MLVRHQLRSRLTESTILHLTGLDTKDLIDTTRGVPNYHPSELPKIHVDFETGVSEEDTLDRSLSLVETTLNIRLFLTCQQDFRKVMEDYSLELTYKIRSSGLVGDIDKLIDLNQTNVTYEIDEESSPVVGIMTHRYIMRYRI